MNTTERIEKLEEFVADLFISQSSTSRMINELHESTLLLFNKVVDVDKTVKKNSKSLSSQMALLKSHTSKLEEINHQLIAIEKGIKELYKKSN
jgi:hypothetical protein